MNKQIVYFLATLWVANLSANFNGEEKIIIKKNLESVITAESGKQVSCLLGIEQCLEALSGLKNHQEVFLTQEAPYTVSNYELKKFSKGPKVFNYSGNDLSLLNSEFDSQQLEAYLDTDSQQSKLSPQEQNFYEDLYADGILNISIFNGYLDHGVGAKKEWFHFEVELLGRAINNIFLSTNGFQIEVVDRNLSIGTLKINDRKKIVVKIYNSSAFCNSEKNLFKELEDSVFYSAEGTIQSFGIPTYPYFFLREKCDIQETVSSKIRSQFLKSIGEEDVIVYNGHSRSGRGPDFGPRMSVSGSVKRELFTQLAISSPTLKGLYFNGCSGKENYPELIKNFPSQDRMVVWNDAAPEFSDSFYTTIFLLQSLIEERTLKDIEKRANLLRRTDIWTSVVKVNGLID
ncbi:MAG: hypothetical protein K9K67_13765 [Bacteriovoracaceae bacterium]|nr:hypothetical protein [Bacteriovoracaceae bacterium]